MKGRVAAFQSVLEFVQSAPLDPTTTVCAIALLAVASMIWVIVFAHAAPQRRPPPRRPPARSRPARGGGVKRS